MVTLVKFLGVGTVCLAGLLWAPQEHRDGHKEAHKDQPRAAAKQDAKAEGKHEGSHEHAPKPAESNPLFEKIKGLAGEWVWDGPPPEGFDSKGVVISYRVTSAGSAVLETINPGGPHEMITVYHMDGKNVVLTHYCALANQPQMKAGKLEGNTVSFEFCGGCNIDPAKDMHMHDAKMEFVDADHLKSWWRAYADGKQTEEMAFVLKRKK